MRPTVIVALLALAILTMACAAPTEQAPASDVPDERIDAEPPSPEGPGQEDTGDGDVTVDDAQDDADDTTTPPEPQQVTLVAYRWGWEPSTITVRKGTPVVLTVTSRDGTHRLSIPDLGVSSGDFSPGETKIVEFTPEQEGEYQFSCNVYCGEGHGGMRGTLVVTG